MELTLHDIPLSEVDPNPWNPNKQTDRQYEAEIESIRDNGFVMPIIVREHEGRFQIIDGEHRYRALSQIIDSNLPAKGNVPDLSKRRVIPSIVLNVGDAYAKRLTIILNETRGRADFALLSDLLNDISSVLGDELLSGLPYTQQHLNELMAISDFDWSSLEVTDEIPDDGSHDPLSFKVTVVLDPEGEALWRDAIAARADSLPDSRKEQPGALVKQLLKEATA